MRAHAWWARLVAAAAILAAVVWRLGSGPFLDGVRAVDGRTLLFAAGIGALTTVCCAWRWATVAAGLGVPLSFRAAVAAYYRSVFLNLTLPGGIAGDVHRGVSHGREVRDVGRALRAVVWERAAGQFVQAVLTAAVLLVLPSPVRSSMPLLVGALAVTALALVLVDRSRARGGTSRLGRIRDAAAVDIRSGLLRREALPVVVLASALVVGGHAATFVVAARAAGVTAPLTQLLPLALLALLGMVLPSIAGWGPREGVTAWVFGAAGLGADRGVATAVAYGIMALVAGLPGALVLVAALRPRGRRSPLGGRTHVTVRAEGVPDA